MSFLPEQTTPYFSNQLLFPPIHSAEEKLAHLLVALSFAANKTPDLRSLVFVLFRSFIKGHFLSLDAVIEYSKKITAERVVGNEELVN